MSRKRIGRAFSEDNRAVSAVIGFILVFGILMLMLSVYQAQIVPQQNAQTEFEHFEDNKNEMIELRNAISDSGQNDFSRFASVNLGPSYQTRLLTINPAPPAGTLQTQDAPPIKIWNESKENPEVKNVSTKFIQYQPGYNELNTGPVWYEHSVLYLDERDRGNDVSIIEDQSLIVNSTNSLAVTPIQNDFQRSGTERVTLELYTNESAVGSLPDDYRILIPTRLDGTYWNNTNIPEEAWADEDSAVDRDPDLESYDQFDDEPIFGLNLTNDNSESPELDLDLNTVGIQSVPDVEEDELRNMPVQSGKDRDNGGNGNNGGVDELTATVEINERGRPANRIESATFEHSPTPSNNIDFSIRQDGSVIASESSVNSPTEVSISGSPRDLPVDLRADIENGDCYEIQIPDDTEDDEEFNLLEQGDSCE